MMSKLKSKRVPAGVEASGGKLGVAAKAEWIALMLAVANYDRDLYAQLLADARDSDGCSKLV